MTQNWLKLGDWNANCDSCGLKFKASQLMKRWDGLMVCKDDWEVKHPQLSLKVPEDIQSVPFARPEPTQDLFINSCNIVNSQGIAGMSVAGCAIAGKIASGSLT